MAKKNEANSHERFKEAQKNLKRMGKTISSFRKERVVVTNTTAGKWQDSDNFSTRTDA